VVPGQAVHRWAPRDVPMWPGKISEEAYLDAWHSNKNAEIRVDGPDDEPRAT
jgi:hypothetical protein